MATKADKPVLLIGGIRGASPDEVFRLCSRELGDLPVGFPDGEFNERKLWVLFVPIRVWEFHPDLETIRRPKGVPGMPHYIPTGYDDLYKYRVKPGIDHIHVPTTTYPIEARASYLVFRNLRDKGVLPKDARFQVSLPFPEDAARLFTTTARDAEIMSNGYAEAVLRDVMEMLQDIPADDLVLQWDINWETLAIEVDDCAGVDPLQFKCNGDPRERYINFIRQLCGPIPEEVVLGLHLCYGDLHHRHFLEPKDLSICVEMSNAAIKEAGRRIDFLHFPVPRSRGDDDYFKPLENLEVGDTTLYIGLVHYTDGVEGTRARLATFKKHFDGFFGVAAECGMGRRPLDQDLARLLAIHREVAKAL
jgi:hypothetical protein